MVKITREDVLKLGTISNITIHEHEIEPMVEKLQAVLSYAVHLKDIAAQHKVVQLPVQSNVMRPDVVIPTDPEPLLELAPQREENFYVVPVIIKN